MCIYSERDIVITIFHILLQWTPVSPSVVKLSFLVTTLPSTKSPPPPVLSLPTGTARQVEENTALSQQIMDWSRCRHVS